MLSAVPHALGSDEEVPLQFRTRLAGRARAGRSRLGRLGSDARTVAQRARTRSSHALDASRPASRVTAGEIAAIEEELDAVYGVLMRAEAAGVAVNISYVV